MTAIEWNSEFETGVREIDDQHRRLVGYVNELNEVVDQPHPDREVVADVLEQVIDYTLYHFAFEEEFLEATDYHLLDAHKEVHRKFTERMRDLRRRFRAGEMCVHELNDTLTRWLFDHIRHADTAAISTESIQGGNTACRT